MGHDYRATCHAFPIVVHGSTSINVVLQFPIRLYRYVSYLARNVLDCMKVSGFSLHEGEWRPFKGQLYLVQIRDLSMETFNIFSNNPSRFNMGFWTLLGEPDHSLISLLLR